MTLICEPMPSTLNSNNNPSNSKKLKEGQAPPKQPANNTFKLSSLMPSSIPSTLPSSDYFSSKNYEAMKTKLQDALEKTAEWLRYNVNEYPPVAAFLFSLIGLSVIPVASFLIFMLTTSAFVIGVSVVSFLAIEGFFFMIAGGILLSLLTCITFVTMFAFGSIAVVYWGFKGTFFATRKIKNKLGDWKQSAFEAISSGPSTPEKITK